jgi:phospholipid/cholesterol/gamma-HCH transport system substrate-binding protein
MKIGFKRLNLALKKNEIKVGIFVIFPFIVLFVLILFKLGYSLSSTTMDLYLKIDNINSIKIGTPIKVKGYLIGRVVDIKPVYEPSLHFLALMRVNTEITLYESSSAIIKNQSVIGDPVVEILNPESKENPLRDGDVLEGVQYVSIEALLQDVHALLDSTKGAISVIKDMSSESRGNIRKLTTDLAKSMSTLNSILSNSQSDLVEIIANVKKTAKNASELSEEMKSHPVKTLMK